jgi:hypothetical protein
LLKRLHSSVSPEDAKPIPAARAPICVEMLWAFPIFTISTTMKRWINRDMGKGLFNNIKILQHIFLLLFVIGLTHQIQGQPLVERYPTGEVRATGSLLEGQKSGEWKYFYPNGKRNAIEHYTRGMLDGEILYFFRVILYKERKPGCKAS